MDPAYQINAPAVVSEVIEGEAIVMHLKSGKYFSAASSGGLIWACIERSQPISHVVELFFAQYTVTVDQAKAAVDGFIAELLAHELIRPMDGGEPATKVSLSDIGGSTTRHTYLAPVLNVYSDMQDLLLLDPIHDVDEAGWPTPAASTKT